MSRLGNVADKLNKVVSGFSVLLRPARREELQEGQILVRQHDGGDRHSGD